MVCIYKKLNFNIAKKKFKNRKSSSFVQKLVKMILQKFFLEGIPEAAI